MYGSDYPHDESRFPESAKLVTAWHMAEERKRKLLWDNAARFDARVGLALSRPFSASRLNCELT
jgi:hypothetical protein